MAEPRTAGLLGTPALTVAVGATLATVRLPLLGDLGLLLGGGLVVVGSVLLRRRVVDGRARRTATLALVAGVTSLVAPLLASVATGTDASVAVGLAVGLAAGTAAVSGVAVAGAREEVARAHPNLAAGWWIAAAAVVVAHGPIVLTVVLSATVDGTIPSVSGVAAFAVAAAMLAPLALLARAGWRSDVAPLRARGGHATASDADRHASRDGSELSAS